MLKIDMHVHTAFSPDAVIQPEELVRRALKAGLDGVAVTDHDTTDGIESARNAAEDKIIVIPGVETKVDGIEVLCLFVEETPKETHLPYLVREVHSLGGVVILPHPLRQKKPVTAEILAMVDAVEAVNARSSEAPMPTTARHHIPATGGSDAHFPREVGRAYTKIYAEDEADIPSAVREGRIEPVLEKRSSMWLRAASYVLKRIR